MVKMDILFRPGLTFEEWIDAPYGEWSETGKLTEGDFQTEERYANKHQADGVGDQEGTWTTRTTLRL